MKLKAYYAVCLMLIFISGCASHNVVRQPDLSFDLKAQENAVKNKGISCMVKVFHSESDLKTYFDEDLLKSSVLPVQIHLCNKSYGKTVVFNTDGINLIDPTGNRVPGMSLEQVIAKAEKSMWRAAGWGVAFGIFGIIPSLINVENTNEKIRKDYESRMIKGGNIVKGGVTEGLVCFAVPEDISNLSGWKIGVVLKDMESSENIILQYGLFGTIVSPQERMEEDNKEIEKLVDEENI